ncbi:hypothetical protein N0V84_006387 [Fusarium piperis]|uniref:Uncharacterized protein n=1 Tax=Fusarium piperis TaxID=1435070 RepID=A0A9W8WC44_9HYPO|nr:hypothetical protein N0V84_006387 [Fusarium piperis]
MFASTKDKVFFDRLNDNLNQAACCDGIADAGKKDHLVNHLRALVDSPDSFDMQKAEDAAAVCAELFPSSVLGFAVDAPKLLELARGLREGTLTRFALAEARYWTFILSFYYYFHDIAPSKEDAQRACIMHAYRYTVKNDPFRRRRAPVRTPDEAPSPLHALN